MPDARPPTPSLFSDADVRLDVRCADPRQNPTPEVNERSQAPPITRIATTLMTTTFKIQPPGVRGTKILAGGKFDPKAAMPAGMEAYMTPEQYGTLPTVPNPLNAPPALPKMREPWLTE